MKHINRISGIKKLALVGKILSERDRGREKMCEKLRDSWSNNSDSVYFNKIEIKKI